jgi:pyruvate kinase
VTLAGSGLTALHVSKRRPGLPIVALSSKTATLRRLNLLRGVRPVAIPSHADVEDQLALADQFLLDAGWSKEGSVVVTVAAIPLGSGKDPNTIRFHRVRPVGAAKTVWPSKPG